MIQLLLTNVMFLPVLSKMKHVETNTNFLQLIRYTIRRARNSLATKLGPFLGPKTALNDLFHSNSAFSEFIELLSVDSPDES